MIQLKNAKIDFSESIDTIKPMHGVNNGPVCVRQVSNAAYFKAAEIPFVRIHDAAFCEAYGGSHTVDIPNIFPDFGADPIDPKSYDFTLTDQYLESIDAVGAKVFFRLGVKIEHEIKKYGTIPPTDFNKWAKICEMIIRHYNEGWSNGPILNIEYWEIWNEADLHSLMWQGTDEQYFELYAVTACHLKSCFPGIKVGGPAVSGLESPKAQDFCRRFFQYLKNCENEIPVDFYSWHIYHTEPQLIADIARIAMTIPKEYGYENVESILDEWNFCYGWEGEKMSETFRTIKSMKGAAFTSAVMCACQKAKVDKLMYYDARPCSYNGIFNTDTFEPLKGYYPFLAWSQLYKLKNECFSTSDCDKIYVCAAKSNNEAGALISYYDSDDSAEEIDCDIELLNFSNGTDTQITGYLLNETNDLEQVLSLKLNSENLTYTSKFKPNSTMLFKIKSSDI